jgi:hypothetical protein
MFRITTSTMQKFTTYIILISLLAGGLLLVYRSFLSTDDFINIKGMVLEKKIEAVSVSKGSSRYGIVCKIDNYKNKVGVYVGTYEQAKNNRIINLIEVNKVYTFLIDPSVSVNNGTNLGVREIWFSGEVLHKESQNFTLFAGIFFISLCSFALFIIYKANQRKSNR